VFEAIIGDDRAAVAKTRTATVIVSSLGLPRSAKE
jgi:hypothetical protein